MYFLTQILLMLEHMTLKEKVTGYLGNVYSYCFGKPWAQLLDLEKQRGGWNRQRKADIRICKGHS